jgi:hypothetical protein
MAHRVALRRTKFESRAAELGLDSQSAQARAIGVAPSIHHRVLKGERGMSAEYALGVLRLFGDDHLIAQIEALFGRADEQVA